MSTHAERLKVARDYFRRIRRELDELEDIFQHAESFRSDAFNTSLMRSWQSAESAKIEAIQFAVRKVSST